MVKKLLNNYINFSKEIWILALITFINRAGTMVIPFLSKYMHEDLKFTYSQIGWVMVCFGIGSIIGTWLSGKLSDNIGFYKVMFISLFSTGILFFLLQHVSTFVLFSLGVLILTTVADLFRPAMMISLNSYTKRSNRTRSLALIRAAVNLGFLVGSLIGGYIILNVGFDYLFYIDGATCIISVFIFLLFVRSKKLPFTRKKDLIPIKYNIVFSDKPFLIHLIITTITAVLFFQIFTVLPLYQTKQFVNSDFSFAALLFINALILLLFELPIVNYIESSQYNKTKVISIGLCAMIFSYVLLLIFDSNSIVLFFMIIFMSIGVMLTFPFSSEFAMVRSRANQEGQYMAVFTMSYSIAHIIGSKSSLFIIDFSNYNYNWMYMIFLGLVGILMSKWLRKLILKETELDNNKIMNSLFKK